MKGKQSLLLVLFSTPVCTTVLLGLLTLAARWQTERVVTLLLSTEILAPALIFGPALTAYFSGKSDKWRYIQ